MLKSFKNSSYLYASLFSALIKQSNSATPLSPLYSPAPLLITPLSFISAFYSSINISVSMKTPSLNLSTPSMTETSITAMTFEEVSSPITRRSY